jgi:hypothetical protein
MMAKATFQLEEKMSSKNKSAIWLVMVCLVLCGSALAYSIDELVFLNGFGWQGKAGLLDTSDLVSQNNSLGFSLKIQWNNDSDGKNFWSIRQSLRPGLELADFDTLSFDLYLEQLEGNPSLLVFLLEKDDDRWVCLSQKLANVIPNTWHHFQIDRAQMRGWPIGNGKLEWEKIGGLAFELSGDTKTVFYVDGVKLTGQSAQEQVFNCENDGLWADPNWEQPLRWPSESGYVYLPCLTTAKLLEAQVPLQFKRLFGRFGTSAYGPVAVNSLLAQDIPYVYYSNLTSSFIKYLTRQQAFDQNQSGESPNFIPFAQSPDFLRLHSYAFAHPAVFEGCKQIVDALVKSGIGVWMVADYTFPWKGGRWGYAPVMVDAYRKDLLGIDEGLMIRDGIKTSTLRFPDYFRAYNGFFPLPEDLALTSWEEFAPPLPDAGGTINQKRWVLFLYLRSYEWVKLADKIGRYYHSKGGQGLWMIPNPEDTYGSSDYVFLVRSEGVGNLFPEWFGNVAFHAEAAYHSLSYLREQADRGGSRLSVLFETGAGGHGAPYWDWRVAYNGAYVLSAASRADDFDNDFLDHATFEQMSEPTHPEFVRFRDGVAKALAFQQARAEFPKVPETNILCVADRPPAKATGSLFSSLDRKYSFASGLSRAHLPFQLRDSFELEKNLEQYAVLFYSPREPRVGDLELIHDWLVGKPGRTLVTHSFVPTRDAADFGGMNTSAYLGKKSADQLGLGEITSTGEKSFAITEVTPLWRDLFSPGQQFALTNSLTAIEHGETLIGTDCGPLVSRVRVGESHVIYLHYPPNDTGTESLDVKVMEGIANFIGQKPICLAEPEVAVQAFELANGCGYSIAAWDLSALSSWRKEEGPLKYDSSGVNRTIEISVPCDQPLLVYDFWDDKLTVVEPRAGKISLQMKDVSTALYYVGVNSSKFEDKVLREVQNSRQKIKELDFEELP